MSGSGIEELLECVYASNTVGHMLSGKAVQRAFTGHLLVKNALNAILTADASNLSLPAKACFGKNYEKGKLVKDRRQTVPVLDSVVVERDVLNVADTEPVNRGDRSQTVQCPTALWLSAMFSMLKTQSQGNSATKGKQFLCPTESRLSTMFDLLKTQRQ